MRARPAPSRVWITTGKGSELRIRRLIDGYTTVASSPILMYPLGREWGVRSTTSIPAKNAAECSVPAIWQVPPPTPSMSSPPEITVAMRKPLASERSPTTALKSKMAPGIQT
jgi:hypothetical protein